MNLIKISGNTLVNPEKISMIEFQDFNGVRQLVVTIEGQQKVATISAIELLSEFTKAGVTTDDKLFQFWAG